MQYLHGAPRNGGDTPTAPRRASAPDTVDLFAAKRTVPNEQLQTAITGEGAGGPGSWTAVETPQINCRAFRHGAPVPDVAMPAARQFRANNTMVCAPRRPARYMTNPSQRRYIT